MLVQLAAVAFSTGRARGAISERALVPGPDDSFALEQGWVAQEFELGGVKAI
jgi:hypothetical protein